MRDTAQSRPVLANTSKDHGGLLFALWLACAVVGTLVAGLATLSILFGSYLSGSLVILAQLSVGVSGLLAKRRTAVTDSALKLCAMALAVPAAVAVVYLIVVWAKS